MSVIKKQLSYTFDESKVEKLPTIGEPYNLKTRKQGRVGSIQENLIDPLLYTLTKNGLKKRTSVKKRKFLAARAVYYKGLK